MVCIVRMAVCWEGGVVRVMVLWWFEEGSLIMMMVW